MSNCTELFANFFTDIRVGNSRAAGNPLGRRANSLMDSPVRRIGLHGNDERVGICLNLAPFFCVLGTQFTQSPNSGLPKIGNPDVATTDRRS